MSSRDAKDHELLANIKSRWSELATLLEEMSLPRVYEDRIYRFYCGSFKVYHLQDETQRIIEALRKIAPEGTSFCAEFEEICQAGASGKEFEGAHNQRWTAHTRVIVEAFLHAKYFLETAVKYGRELSAAPSFMPSGWAALLCLYGIR